MKKRFENKIGPKTFFFFQKSRRFKTDQNSQAAGLAYFLELMEEVVSSWPSGHV